MAKKKPAGKMPVKKPAAKVAVKKPVAKAPIKKAAPMAKKAPAKKAAPAAKKAAPKKVEKKPAAKPSLKETVLKAAGKLLAPKAKPLTKEQEKKLKEKEKAQAAKDKAAAAKEAAKAKALAAKEKEKEAKDKAKQKELEKKQKEQEKAQMKADKEAEKERLKEEKNAGKKKGKKSSDDEEDGDIELTDEDDWEANLNKKKRVSEEDDVDEFEEDYKKSKAAKKGGKKAYEEDVQLDAFPVKQSKKYNNAILADLEASVADEIAQLREHFNWKEIAEAIGTMDFFIDAKNDECIEKGCDNIRTTQSYCRLHYLRNWKTVQKKRDILKEGKLQEYIEELISKYPPKYIEALLSDLSDDKEFYKVLNELNITSEFDFEEDEFENAVDDDDADDDIGIETISSSLRYEDE